MAQLIQIKLFIDVAKYGSFISAARKNGLTGPAVSKHIMALEHRLGVRLFARTTRQVFLTDEGKYYLDKVSQAICNIEEAEKELLELKDCPKGPLKISVPMSLGHMYLRDFLTQFAKDYPEVELTIDFNDGYVDLHGDHYDAVIRAGALKDNNLYARHLSDNPLIICASPLLMQKYATPKEPADISTIPAIIYNKHGLQNYWHYQHHNKVAYVSLSPHLITNTAEMMLTACLQGLGICLLPYFACKPYLDQNELIQLLPQYPSYPPNKVYLVYKEKEHQSTRLKLFIDAAIRYIKTVAWYAKR